MKRKFTTENNTVLQVISAMPLGATFLFKNTLYLVIHSQNPYDREWVRGYVNLDDCNYTRFKDQELGEVVDCDITVTRRPK